MQKNRVIILFVSIFLISACGTADDLVDDLEIVVKTDSLLVVPPSSKDSMVVTPPDSIQIQDDMSTVPDDSIVINPLDTTLVQNDTTFVPKDSIGNGSANNEEVEKDTAEVSYCKYMSLSPSYGIGQGGACYDKYFIQGYQNNGAFGIYDLEEKKSLGKIDITNPVPSSKIHANTLNFGTQRYDRNDFFPLLYVSSGYPRNVNGSSLSFIYVYRITKSENVDGDIIFDASLIQTISLKGFGYWTEGIIDNDHNVLWLKYEPGGEYKYASFNVPKYDAGDIEISLDEHIVDFSIGEQPFMSSNQGHLFYNDRILLVSGISPNTQKLAFIVINTLTHSRELVIDLAEIGLRSEPENVFFYHDQLMVGYRKSIYNFNVKSIHER